MRLSPILLVLASAACVQTAIAVTPAAAPGIAGNQSEVMPNPAETPAQRDARMKWWREAKFGLFIHWGVYAVPAGSYGGKTNYGEWIMQSARIPVAEYRGFAKQFNPTRYDPEKWVELARQAGMRYIVITAKHHDGFALFPSQVSKWNVADATPYKKDLLGPLVTAAHGQGLRIGFYYSQSQDWNNPGGAKSGFKEGGGWDVAQAGNYDDYLNQTAAGQVREILTRYPIDILWWDTPMFMTPARMAPFTKLLRLRPGLITNNRLGNGTGDTATPEQFVPVTGIKGDWETCMTMNRHWGYNAADTDWKSSADLIRKLADICSKGGNFLLNVGPTADGEFPAPCVERLRDMGRWLQTNGDAIYGTTAGPFAHLSWGVATRKGDRLFLHVFDWPKDGRLRVPLQSEPTAAWLMSAPEKQLAITREHEHLTITVPNTAPDPVDSVIVLDLSGPPVAMPLPTTGAKATASTAMPGSEAANAVDGTAEKCWRAPADAKSAWLEIDLRQPVDISGLGIAEPDVWPRLKQKFTLEAEEDGRWRKVIDGSTEGHGVALDFASVTAQRFRLTMECAKGSPGLAEVQLYRPD